jgi:hypothetical protein
MKIKLEVELDTDKQKDEEVILKLIELIEEYRNGEYDECE